MKIPVGISARHMHITKENFVKLFGYDKLTHLKDINQPGLFACEETLTIKGPKGEIENVRILGPFRDYTQVEVSKTDAYQLGCNPPMRRSGVLDEADDVTLIGPRGEITLNCLILANRHIHISEEEANSLNIKDNQEIDVKISSQKPGIIRVYFKISKEAYKELHLDLDDSNAFLLNQGDEVEVLL